MKKTLLLGALALFGLSAGAAVLENGHYYKLKSVGDNVTEELYLNMEIDGVPDSGHNACANATASTLYVTAKENSETEFRFQANSTQGNTLSANGWNSRIDGTGAFYWTVAEVDYTVASGNKVVTLNQQVATEKGYLGYGNASAINYNKPYAAWCNCSIGDGECLWEVIEVSHPITYTFKSGDVVVATETVYLPYGYDAAEYIPEVDGFTGGELAESDAVTSEKNVSFTVINGTYHAPRQVTYSYMFNGKAVTKSVKLYDDDNAAEHIPAMDLFTATGLEATNTTVVSEKNTAFTVNGTWNLPVANQVYRVTLGPSNTNSRPIKLDNSNTVKSIYSDTEADAVNAANFWYFKYDHVSVADGQLQLYVTMHTLAATDAKGLEMRTGNENGASNGNARLTLVDNPTVMLIEPTTWGDRQAGDFVLKHNSANSWVNQRDNYFSTWNNSAARNGSGSVIRISALTEADYTEFAEWNSETDVNNAKANPSHTNIRNLLANMNPYAADIEKYITNASAFAEMGIATDATVAAWNTAKAAILAKTKNEYTEADKTSALTAYTNMVNSSANTPGGAHVMFAANKNPNNYMYIDETENNEVMRNALATVGGKTTWTLVKTENGFHLFNEYANRYAKFPTSNENPNIAHSIVYPAAVISAEEASVFVFDIYDAATARYGIKCISSEADANSCYYHTNATTHVPRWIKDANSSWYLSASDEATAASEHLNGAVAMCAVPEGSELIGYAIEETANAAAAAHAAAVAAQAEGTSDADRRVAADALWAANNAIAYHLPEAGKLYTIRGAHADHSAKYLTENYNEQAEYDGESFDKVIAAQNNGNVVPAMWRFDLNGEGDYADHYKIRSVNSGNVLRESHWHEALVTLPATNAKAGNYTILDTELRQLGGVTLRSNFPGDKGHVSVTDDGTCDDNNVMSWNAVTDGNNWVIEPVDSFAVALNANGYAMAHYPFAVKVYDAVPCVVGLYDGESAMTITALNAEDKTYIPANTPVILRGEPDTAVTLYIDYAPAAMPAAEDAANGFTGVLVPAAAENAFVLNGDKLVKTTEAVPANSLYFASEAPVNEIAMTADETTGIDEITVNDNNANVIYDLQGRRLAAPVKGINIINGKKVLVR